MIRFAFLLAATASVATATQDFSNATFEWLPEASNTLAGGTQYRALSADGATVVGTALAGPPPFGNRLDLVRWTAGSGAETVGTFMVGTDVSADGSVLIGGADALGGAASHEAMRWTEAAGFTGLGAFQPTGDFSRATGISTSGDVIVGFSDVDVDSPRAFRWTATGGLVRLDSNPGVSLPGFESSQPVDVSGDGQVAVGSASFSTHDAAVRWVGLTGIQPLGTLAGPQASSRAIGANSDGTVIVGDSQSAAFGSEREAFVWTAGTGMIGIGVLPGAFVRSDATGVDASGRIVVGTSRTATGPPVAFIWTAALGMRQLSDVLAAAGVDGFTPGTDLGDVAGISADGNAILGWNTAANGVTRNWIVRSDVIGRPFCTTPTTGAQLRAHGSRFVHNGIFQLDVTGAAPRSSGVLLSAPGFGMTSVAGASGLLCVAGAPSVGRPIRLNAAGQASVSLDLNMIPTAQGLTMVLPGETWVFQAWVRTTAGTTPPSTFSNGIGLRFE